MSGFRLNGRFCESTTGGTVSGPIVNFTSFLNTTANENAFDVELLRELDVIVRMRDVKKNRYWVTFS
jgi:hypothetical protein